MQGARRHRGGLIPWSALVALVLVAASAAVDAAGSSAEEAIRTVITTYGHAIETKDLDLFRSVKPNLSADEEKRLLAAFASTGRHEVQITVVSIEVAGDRAVAQLSRRDTLEGSIVSSFPQKLRMALNAGAWTIEEIGR